MQLTSVNFHSYNDSIPQALNAIHAEKILSKQSAVLIKPNLVNDSPFPITTSPDCCEAVIAYIRSVSNSDIIIAEGCGAKELETSEIFETLGYTRIAEQLGINLIDLNTAPLKKLQNPNCPIFPEIYLPEIAFTHFIISVPVLKAHSLSVMTGTLKNMMGFAPPKYYSGKYGVWKKAQFHNNMHQSIMDLNQYLVPDLTILDASVGLADYHLGGAECSPHVKKIIAGYDPYEVDRAAATLLGYNWKEIPHIANKSA